jgi:integrase
MKQSLNDATIKNAKPSGKTITLKDGGGLFLYVEPNGSKRWRFRYRFNDKPCLLSLGLYPDVSLKQARDKRNELHAQVVAGINPSAQRKAIKAGAALNTFEAVAREWFAEHAPSCSKGTADKKISLLERDVFPWLGSQAIDSITAPDVLTVVRRLKDRGVLYTAHRALGICGQIFRYGVQTGRCVRNVTPDLRGALPQPVVKHMAAFTEPKDVARFIRSFDNFNGTYSVQCALNLMVLFFVRPVELRTARWQDMDLDAGEWRFFVGKTKDNQQSVAPFGLGYANRVYRAWR